MKTQTKLMLLVISICLFLMLCFAVFQYIIFKQKETLWQSKTDERKEIAEQIIYKFNHKNIKDFQEILRYNHLSSFVKAHNQLNSEVFLQNDFYEWSGAIIDEHKNFIFKDSLFPNLKHFIELKSIKFPKQMGYSHYYINTFNQINELLILPLPSYEGFANKLGEKMYFLIYIPWKQNFFQFLEKASVSNINIISSKDKEFIEQNNAEKITTFYIDLINSDNTSNVVLKFNFVNFILNDFEKYSYLSYFLMIIFMIFAVLVLFIIFRRQVVEPLNLLNNIFKNYDEEKIKKLKAKSYEFEQIGDLIEDYQKSKTHSEKLLVYKNEFVSTVTHEIRTPLNGIIGMLQLLKETNVNTEQKTYLDSLSYSSEILLKILNDTLDLSKIEAGKLSLENSPFYLRDLLEEILEIISVQASQKGLELFYTIDKQADISIISDSLRLKQILINLIGNGIKFTEKGFVCVEVSVIQRYKDKATFQFVVKDSGIGIPAHKYQQLFKAFNQLDSSMARKYGGTGLGLAICLKLVELFDGKISVESNETFGTSFTFTINTDIMNVKQSTQININANNKKNILLISDNKEFAESLMIQLKNYYFKIELHSVERFFNEAFIEEYDSIILDFPNEEDLIKKSIATINTLNKQHWIVLFQLGNKINHFDANNSNINFLSKPIKWKKLLTYILKDGKKITEPEEKSSFTWKKIYTTKKILVVEDNLINQRLILKILEKMDLKADVANDGIDAIEMQDVEFYDFIFMDIELPTLNGSEVSRYIRKQSKYPHQPIIYAMTANVMEKNDEFCNIYGMNGFISKPISVEEIQNILIENLNK